jgi:ABC-type Fe3+/spermidine/putrescine transport system ATPase subunit
MPLPVFAAEHLRASYDDRVVIDDLSLDLAPGETLALVGASGAGKSTLLEVLACLRPAEAGTLRLDGEPVDQYAHRLVPGHPQIKLVPQAYQLFPNHSLRENITYALRTYTKAYQRQRVGTLLERFGLEAVADRLPREVSGGEQQRTAIARALADEPKVLLLDEPFSHLDTLNKQVIKTELRTLVREEETACVLVTHDLIDAFTAAERVGVLRAGALLQVGTTAEVLHQPRPGYVSELVASGRALWREFGALLEGRES